MKFDPAVAEDIAGLVTRPSFLTLTAHWEDLMEANTTRLARAILSLPAPLDQRKVDHDRGYWKGVQDVLRSPELAAKAWQRHVAKESESVE